MTEVILTKDEKELIMAISKEVFLKFADKRTYAGVMPKAREDFLTDFKEVITTVYNSYKQLYQSK